MSEKSKQDDYWQQAAGEYGPALERLAWAYEADPDRRRDLLQEIHLALWRSFECFDARCSLRTWIYRVAHNVATSHVIRQKKGMRWSFVRLKRSKLSRALKTSRSRWTVSMYSCVF